MNGVNMEKINFIFLDIDGVIQPVSSKNRFEHTNEDLQNKLYKETNDSIYLEINIFDLLAVYYDWNIESLMYLEKLCIGGKGLIVLESDWRSKGHEIMKAFFKLYNLDYLYYDEIDASLSKEEAIKKYLSEHDGEYNTYVIIDDYLKLKDEELNKHLVTTSRYLNELYYKQALHILNGKKVFKYVITSQEEYNKISNSDEDVFYFILPDKILTEIEEYDLIELDSFYNKMNLIVTNISKKYGIEAVVKFSEAIKPKGKNRSIWQATSEECEYKDCGVLKAKVLKI